MNKPKISNETKTQDQQIITPEQQTGEMTRRSFIENITKMAAGAIILFQGGQIEAKEKKKLSEVTIQDFVVIGSSIENVPENFKKNCIMNSETGICDGSEYSKPFETRDFVMNVFNNNKPVGDPNKPVFEIFKKGDSIQVTKFTWEGEKSGRSILKKDDDKTKGLLYLLKALSKIGNK